MLAPGENSRRGPALSRDSSDYDILILDAEHKQALAAARSLGRVGLRIALAESRVLYRERPPLPAFQSRYCSRSLVLPSYVEDPGTYANAVIDFVRENPTRVVLPVGDATCVTLMPHRRELAELGCVLALPPDRPLAIALDKDRTLGVAAELGIAYPMSLRIRGIEDVAVAIAEFGFPFVLKPTVSWTGKGRVLPIEVVDKEEATRIVGQFIAEGAVVLAQKWLPGLREGVTLFIVGGEVVASCGHVEHRTTPQLGGVSVLRESTVPAPDIYDPAVRLAMAMEMEGLCEVEFRRDATGRPLLMEVNPRLPGSLNISILSGVDFPLLIWQLASGQPVTQVGTYRPGIRMRWLHGELRWLRDNYGRAGRPDSVSRSRGIWTFLSEFVRTRHYDYIDWDDIKPAVAEMRYTATVLLKSFQKQQH